MRKTLTVMLGAYGVVAYLCIVSMSASMYLLFASVRLSPLWESQASHLSCSRAKSSPAMPELALGRSMTPSTSPSIACLYRPYRRIRSAGGGRAAPVLGIFLTVFRAWTKTRSMHVAMWGKSSTRHRRAGDRQKARAGVGCPGTGSRDG